LICVGTGFCLSISVLPRHLPFYQWPYSYARFVVYIRTADVKETTRETAKPQDLKWDEISRVSFLSTCRYFFRNAPNGKFKINFVDYNVNILSACGRLQAWHT
jgi:hypothetical protein